MSVYLSVKRYHAKVDGRRRWHSFVFADSEEELAAFAVKMGYAESWRVDRGGFPGVPHIDVGVGDWAPTRQQAVRAGAIVLDKEETRAFIHEHRTTW